MTLPNSLIVELEAVVHGGSLDKRIATLQRITDLFLNGADHFNDEQVGLFDDVMLRLIKRVETKALEELSRRLAPAPNAPIGVIKHLARHDDILVAAPVLSQSERLTATDLIEIAKTKGHGHLLAISERTLLDETVTDVLLERGDREIFHKLAQNHGAFFSKAGFVTIVKHAESDVGLAEKVGQRIDVPAHLLQELVLKATDAVRARLLATAPAEVHAEIKNVLASVSNKVIQEVQIETRDFKRARDLVLLMQQKNQLSEASLDDFAKKHKYEEMVAALALLCATRFELIERLMRTSHHGGLLVACKAADLKWPTVHAILSNRLPHHPIASHELEQAKVDFAKLTRATAQRLIGFWQVRPESSPT